MSKKKTFLLFGLAFAVTLVVTAPASLLGASLARLTGGALELSSTEGTLWHGSAVPVFHSPRGKPIALQQINWTLSFIPVFTGKITLLISQGRGPHPQPTEISAGIKSVELRHVSLEMPAEVLEELHPLLQALHPQGSLQLTSEQLTLSGQKLLGTATANWQSAASALSTVNPLGNYQIKLNGMDTQITIDLTTLSGPLMLDGQGNWTPAKGLAIEAHAKARAESQEALAELLHHLGPEISPGTRLIKIGYAI